MCENFKLIPLAGARSDIWQHFGFKSNEKGIILNKNQVFCKKCKFKFTFIYIICFICLYLHYNA